MMKLSQELESSRTDSSNLDLWQPAYVKGQYGPVGGDSNCLSSAKQSEEEISFGRAGPWKSSGSSVLVRLEAFGEQLPALYTLSACNSIGCSRERQPFCGVRCRLAWLSESGFAGFSRIFRMAGVSRRWLDWTCVCVCCTRVIRKVPGVQQFFAVWSKKVG